MAVHPPRLRKAAPPAHPLAVRRGRARGPRQQRLHEQRALAAGREQLPRGPVEVDRRDGPAAGQLRGGPQKPFLVEIHLRGLEVGRVRAGGERTQPQAQQRDAAARARGRDDDGAAAARGAQVGDGAPVRGHAAHVEARHLRGGADGDDVPERQGVPLRVLGPDGQRDGQREGVLVVDDAGSCGHGQEAHALDGRGEEVAAGGEGADAAAAVPAAIGGRGHGVPLTFARLGSKSRFFKLMCDQAIVAARSSWPGDKGLRSVIGAVRARGLAPRANEGADKQQRAPHDTDRRRSTPTRRRADARKLAGKTWSRARRPRPAHSNVAAT